MKFSTHNDKDIDNSGTHLEGYLEIKYDQLVERLGKPTDGGGFKTDAEWLIESEGVIATIYNWKNGPSYCGDEGMFPEERDQWVRSITEWQIGGKDKKAVTLVRKLLPAGRITNFS